MPNSILDNDFTLTKRHLGWLLCALGAVIFWGALAVELFQPAPHHFGTLQLLALLLGLGSFLVGLTLLPLGDQPA